MDPDAIVAALAERRDAFAVAHSRMADIAQVYSGERSLVTTELWGAGEKPAVPNLTLVGIDQSAMRVSSTAPVVQFSPVRVSKPADVAARTKFDVTQGWWDANSMRRKDRRRARHLIGYGSSPVLVRPDMGRQIPLWQVYSPRKVFPAPMLDPDEMRPTDVVVTFERTWSWMRSTYPDQFARIYKGAGYKTRRDARVQLAEFWDAESCVLLALAAPRDPYDQSSELGVTRFEVLETVENRAQVCPFVMPGRVSLDDQSSGVFDQNVGLHERQARMMALEEIAIIRGIFSETWIESDTASNPQVITVANAKDGTIGKVQGGRIREIRPDPSMAALQAVDRGERAQRVQAGVPAEFGGESPTNVRTGRRGDSVLSAVVDHPTQEHQELLAESKEHELRIAIAIDRAYFNVPKAVFFSANGRRGAGKEYTARDLWDTDDVSVRYSHPGADANGLVIGGGQRVGLGTLSKRSFQEIDPLVDDPEREHDRVQAEQIEAGVLAEFMQPGTFGVADKARVMQLVRTDQLELAEAILRVQSEAQQRQAPAVNPVDAGAPEAQPGLQEGVGAEAGAVQTPQGVSGLTSLLGALRLGQRVSPQESRFAASTVAS